MKRQKTDKAAKKAERPTDGDPMPWAEFVTLVWETAERPLDAGRAS